MNILFDEAIANQEQVSDKFPKTEAQFKLPPNAEDILDFQIEASWKHQKCLVIEKKSLTHKLKKKWYIWGEEELQSKIAILDNKITKLWLQNKESRSNNEARGNVLKRDQMKWGFKND